jgi:hypothetical protein
MAREELRLKPLKAHPARSKTSLLHPEFSYQGAAHTDVAATLRRVRERQEAERQQAAFINHKISRIGGKR